MKLNAFIAQQIKCHLKRTGWSLRRLAKKTNVSVSRLSRFLNLQGVRMRIDDLAAIAKAFQSPLSSFIPK